MTGPIDKAVKVNQRLADSAEVLQDSAIQQTDSADRRTGLAADRTVLAAERTYAAWVRTALAALASGIGARSLLDKLVPVWLIGVTGTILIAFAGFCLVAAVWREVHPGVTNVDPDIARLPAWLLVAVNAFLLLVCAAAMVGLWASR
jgi:putative membrane protein